MIFRAAAEAECDNAATRTKERETEIRSFLARQTLLLSFFRASPPQRYESRLNLFPLWPSVKTKSRLRAAGRLLAACANAPWTGIHISFQLP
jgi:hypothetical protein